MKIEIVEFDLLLQHEWNIASLLNRPRTTGEPSKTVFLKLESNSGQVGFGECPTARRYGWTAPVILRFLENLNPSKLSFESVDDSMRYIQSLESYIPAAAAGLNMALLDGVASMANKSVSEWLGAPEAVNPVTSFSIGIDSPEKVREKLLEAREFPIIKIKLGGPNDLAVMNLTQEIIPNAILRVDANEAWKTQDEALRKIEWLTSYQNVEFVEQPMPSNTAVARNAWLKERSPLPIIADESFHGRRDVPYCNEGFHGVNAKLVKTGGISEAFLALQDAKALGMKTMLGCMIESSLFISAAAHLAGLVDYLDLDGALLTSNDPAIGVSIDKGKLSWDQAPRAHGLRTGWKIPIFS